MYREKRQKGTDSVLLVILFSKFSPHFEYNFAGDEARENLGEEVVSILTMKVRPVWGHGSRTRVSGVWGEVRTDIETETSQEVSQSMEQLGDNTEAGEKGKSA